MLAKHLIIQFKKIKSEIDDVLKSLLNFVLGSDIGEFSIIEINEFKEMDFFVMMCGSGVDEDIYDFEEIGELHGLINGEDWVAEIFRHHLAMKSRD